MKFENTTVMNFENAVRGMRNSYNSWDKSDSQFGLGCDNDIDFIIQDFLTDNISDWEKKTDDEQANLMEWGYNNAILKTDGYYYEYALLGRNDLELMQKLINAGGSHRKFMRQISVSVDIIAPRYFWAEFDTYKVGTTANSTSSMHTLANSPITLNNFEISDLNEDILKNVENYDNYFSITQDFIDILERLRLKYNETKDKKYWKELIRWLPQGWLQKRTVTMNYENLLSICSKEQRRNHRLTEWSVDFISWAKKLPYAKELIFSDIPDDEY